MVKPKVLYNLKALGGRCVRYGWIGGQRDGHKGGV